jgi:hypothetical protein
MIVLGRETGAGLMSHSTSLRGGVGNTFSREKYIHLTLLRQHERLSRTGTTHKKRMSGVRGLAREENVSCVSDFSIKMYIDSNHHNSQIWVTAYLVIVST